MWSGLCHRITWALFGHRRSLSFSQEVLESSLLWPGCGWQADQATDRSFLRWSNEEVYQKLRTEYDALPWIFPVPLIHIAKADSTNGYLNALCEKEKVSELTTVVADFQTAGRGQRGNSWESEYGKNLMFSFVLYPTFLEARKQFLLHKSPL